MRVLEDKKTDVTVRMVADVNIKAIIKGLISNENDKVGSVQLREEINRCKFRRIFLTRLHRSKHFLLTCSTS